MKDSKLRLFLWLSVAVLGGFAILYFTIPSFALFINESTSILVTADIKRMRIYIRSFGAIAPLVSMGIMVFQSIASPLPAFVVTFANAWVFGWQLGAVNSWTGAMIGAALCWAIGKGFGRPVVEKMVGKTALDKSDTFFENHGRHAVFIARLLPIMPFDVISYAAGLTTMGFWGFFWATGLGQLPATILYSWWGEKMTTSGKVFLWGIAGFLTLLTIAWALKQRASRKGAGA